MVIDYYQIYGVLNMKKIILILLLCLIPSAIFATDFYLGPKAGLNINKFYGSGIDNQIDAINAT